MTIENVLSADIVKVKYSGTKADRTATEALGRCSPPPLLPTAFPLPDFLAYRTYSEQQKLVDNSVAKSSKE
ncbi:MAG: hypothetical protein ACLUI3_11905 [Christensenellales bacterium]